MSFCFSSRYIKATLPTWAWGARPELWLWSLSLCNQLLLQLCQEKSWKHLNSRPSVRHYQFEPCIAFICQSIGRRHPVCQKDIHENWKSKLSKPWTPYILKMSLTQSPKLSHAFCWWRKKHLGVFLACISTFGCKFHFRNFPKLVRLCINRVCQVLYELVCKA